MGKEMKKKGTDVGASMPTQKSTVSENINQYYSNTILKLCLILISVALVLIYIGAYFGNESILILGLGIGAAGGIIQARINIEEDE